MCTVLLLPGVNPITVNKYISYHISYHIISYIISYIISSADFTEIRRVGTLLAHAYRRTGGHGDVHRHFSWHCQSAPCETVLLPIYVIRISRSVFRYIGTAAPLTSSWQSPRSVFVYLLICLGTLIHFSLSRLSFEWIRFCPRPPSLG